MQLLAPARIASLATGLKYSLQHTLDAITAVVDEQQAMAESSDAPPGAGNRWKFHERSPPRAPGLPPITKGVLKNGSAAGEGGGFWGGQRQE